MEAVWADVEVGAEVEVGLALGWEDWVVDGAGADDGDGWPHAIMIRESASKATIRINHFFICKSSLQI